MLAMNRRKASTRMIQAKRGLRSAEFKQTQAELPFCAAEGEGGDGGAQDKADGGGEPKAMRGVADEGKEVEEQPEEERMIVG